MKTSSLLKGVATITAIAVMAGSGAMLAKSSQDYVKSLVLKALRKASTNMTMVITDDIFQDAMVYMSTRISFYSNRFRVVKTAEDNNIRIVHQKDDLFTDTFEGVKLSWILRSRHVDGTEVLYYDLTFPKKAKDLVKDSYLPFVSRKAASTRLRMNTLKHFYRGEADNWRSVTFDHPSTFQTIALDPQVKRNIIHDLDQFVEGRTTLCNHAGKAYKRGYLFYGPHGTGKSSLIAAMVNYLKVDVYDLDLCEVTSDFQLRKLLVATSNGSMIVVEDISPHETKVTLSSLLDIMDRGWSNCGDQRIIVFTTRCKERFDLVLLSLGRMDVEIHMSYCTPSVFESLASTYLQINTHELFKEIMELLVEVQVTSAEVAGNLETANLISDDSVYQALEGLVEFLIAKKAQA